MAITDYASLKTSVASWLHRTNATDIIPDLIAFGENRIYRDLRVRQMETAMSVAISSGVAAVPSGYLELKNAYLDGTPVAKLERKDAEWIYHNYPTRSSDGRPKFIARDAGNFIFGPFPTDTYTLKGTYYKRLDALSDSNTSNWLITDAPEMLLFAALVEAEAFVVNDPRIALWETKYLQLRDRLQERSDDEEFSGSPLSSTTR